MLYFLYYCFGVSLERTRDDHKSNEFELVLHLFAGHVPYLLMCQISQLFVTQTKHASALSGVVQIDLVVVGRQVLDHVLKDFGRPLTRGYVGGVGGAGLCVAGDHGHTFERTREVETLIDLPTDGGRLGSRVHATAAVFRLFGYHHVALGQSPVDRLDGHFFEWVADKFLVQVHERVTRGQGVQSLGGQVRDRSLLELITIFFYLKSALSNSKKHSVYR